MTPSEIMGAEFPRVFYAEYAEPAAQNRENALCIEHAKRRSANIESLEIFSKDVQRASEFTMIAPATPLKSGWIFAVLSSPQDQHDFFGPDNDAGLMLRFHVDRISDHDWQAFGRQAQ